MRKEFQHDQVHHGRETRTKSYRLYGFLQRTLEGFICNEKLEIEKIEFRRSAQGEGLLTHLLHYRLTNDKKSRLKRFIAYVSAV
jgi:hypothetical protein